MTTPSAPLQLHDRAPIRKMLMTTELRTCQGRGYQTTDQVTQCPQCKRRLISARQKSGGSAGCCYAVAAAGLLLPETFWSVYTTFD